MHILMLSDSETHGGAAIAASRLADGFLALGHRCTRIIPQLDGQQSAWVRQELRPAYSHDVPFRLAAHVAGSAIGRRAVGQFLSRRWFREALAKFQPDVINIHNLHGAEWPVEMVAESADFAPTIWTLHDMWSFTGRCVYSGPCERYLTGCDANCPTWDQYPSLPPGEIAQEWRRRKAILNTKLPLFGVTPSRWLGQRAEAGLWGAAKVTTIPNGLPLDLFAPMDTAAARSALGLPLKSSIMVAAASQLLDPRKGMHLLLAALTKLPRPDWILLVFGQGTLDLRGVPIRVVELGSLPEAARQVMAYSAADVYVHPALEDNLPNTVVESIACGTPVISFPVGGLPELVRPGITGWLAQDTSSDGLAAALKIWNGERKSQSLSVSCRRVAEQEYGQTLQASRYLKLWGESGQSDAGRESFEPMAAVSGAGGGAQ